MKEAKDGHKRGQSEGNKDFFYHCVSLISICSGETSLSTSKPASLANASASFVSF